ncbi:MAG: S41 family peptidase, partial [Parcubacteria group bacterium]
VLIVSVSSLLILAIFFSGGFVIGKFTSGKLNYNFNPEIYKQTALPEVFQNSLTQQVWTLLKSDYVDQDKIDEQKLFYGALEGLVGGVGDPYTTLLDPLTAKEFDQQIAGSFEGIGAQIAIKDKVLTVVAPLAGSPAERSGILPGDRIYTINGTQTANLDLDAAARLIRGPRGTEVTLVIVRGDGSPMTFVIKRDVIEVKSVTWNFRTDGLAYVSLTGFDSDTTGRLLQFSQEVKKNKPDGIVLDLRNNPGGLLDTAIEVGSFWLEKKNLVSEKFGDGHEESFATGSDAPFKGIPTVVLINEGSASASEIVAGAFQDYKVATIVGQKSFGKGSVQELRKMPDGSSLKITIAKWLTPNGRSINDLGIEPDIKVEITADDVAKKVDSQLNKAVEILTQKK